MAILDDLLKALFSNPGSLVGKNLDIDGQKYHVNGASKSSGLSGHFVQSNGRTLNQHLSVDDLKKRNF